MDLILIVVGGIVLEQSSRVDGRALFSTSTKPDDGAAPKQNETTRNQKTASSIVKSASGEQVADMKILRTLASYLWMKDNLEFRFRVVAALGFLVGAKVRVTWLLLVCCEL